MPSLPAAIPPLVSAATSATVNVPSFDLGSGLYKSAVIQGRAYRRVDIVNVVFHVIGGILGMFSPPWSIIGTTWYTVGVVPLMLLWVWSVPLRFVARRNAVGVVGGTIGYSPMWTFFSILWYLGFFLAAMISFSASASKNFSDATGAKVTGFMLALFQWCCVGGTVRSAMLVFQTGITYGEGKVCLPDLSLRVKGGIANSASWKLTDDLTVAKWEDVASLVVATSKESFQTVRTTTSGNTRTTTTTTWTRNVLWVCLLDAGEDPEIIGFPVSATGEQSCGGYCCATLERWQERGVLPTHAIEFLNMLAAKKPDLKPQAEAVKQLINGQVKV